MPDNGLAPPNMPWLWQPNSPVGQPNGLGPPMLNYAAPPNPAAPTVGQGVAQTAADVAQALPSWPSVEEQRRMLQPLPGWQGTAVDAAKQWAEGVMMGTTAPGEAPPPGIVAYHGSPHSFDQFDTSKIGTGEGNQAYGHGLYFAANEGVAQTYKGVQGNAAADPMANVAAKTIAAGHDAPARLKQIFPDASADDISAAIERANSPPKGSMYQVSIGADPEHFLDWDKPLSEQHPVVQQALGDLGIQQPSASYNVRPVEGGHVVDYQTGDGTWSTSRVYKSADDAKRQADITMQMMNRDPTGEQLVRQNPGLDMKLANTGLPGIRYLDQGSRAARDPIKLVEGKPYDPSDPTHLASHAMDMASGDRTAAAAIADRHAQLRAAEGDTAGADAMRQASTLLQSPRTIPPMTEGQPPGTHNYVVFDANTIDILRKYGIAGLIAGGGAAAAATQQQQPSQ